MTHTTDTSKHAEAGCCGGKGASDKGAPVGATRTSPARTLKPATPKEAADAAAQGHTPAEHAKHGRGA